MFGPRFLGLEVDPQTKFDLARGVCLAGDVAPRRRIVETHARVSQRAI